MRAHRVAAPGGGACRTGQAEVDEDGAAVAQHHVVGLEVEIHQARGVEVVEDGRHLDGECRGRRGHPVCFAGNLLPELRRVAEHDEGLRSVVRRYTAQVVDVPVNSESVLWNLNDPAAYAAAQARTQ